jgi:hypothetical protein
MSSEKHPNSHQSAPGRLPQIAGQPVVMGVTIKLSKQQKEKLVRLGGAAWIRARIDEAIENKS